MIAKTQPLLSPPAIKSIRFLLCGFALLALSGCAGIKEPPESIPLGKVLVLPFEDMYKVYGKDVSFRCPLCGAVHMIDEVDEGADAFLTERFFEKLREKRDFELVGPGQAVGARSALMSKKGTALKEKELVLETARKVSAQSVAVGQVFRFKERVGTSYSVQSPASVAFDILLYDAVDGRLLWSGHFDETQQALTENLFNISAFVKRGIKWLTARELAADGLDRVLETFPEPPN
jgi:hypothetical protein